jgi:integrase
VASIVRSGKAWRAFVSRKDAGGKTVRRSATFDSKAQAREWSAAQESEIRATASMVQAARTVADLLERYRREVSPGKRGARWEEMRIGLMLRDALAGVKIGALAASDIAGWRDRRLLTVSDATVRREWNLLSACFSVAIREWGWLAANPCATVRRPPVPDARDRLFLCDEVEALLVALGWDDGIPPETISQRVGHALLFALETAMRSGEICALRWSDIAPTVATVRTGKTRAAARRVPLSPYARELLASLPQTDAPVFRLAPAQIDALFRKARDRCGIEDLHWHDSRATAITRLARRLDILDLARMIGHANLGELRTYYRERAEDIAARL